MKKIVATSLLFLFLITNSGLEVSLHWCGQQLASIDFFSSDMHKCPCGEKEMKPGCCEDKTLILKLKTELVKPIQFAFKTVVPEYVFIVVKHFDVLSLANYKCVATEFYYPPPFKPKVQDYIVNGVFLI